MHLERRLEEVVEVEDLRTQAEEAEAAAAVPPLCGVNGCLMNV